MMIISRSRILPFVFTLSLVSVFCEAHTATYTNFDDLLLRTIDALDNALNFFRNNYRDINLDAEIGTRIVEAQFNVLIRRIEENKSWHVPEDIVRSLRASRDLAGEISERAAPFIAASTPDYYRKIGPLLEKDFFDLDYTGRFLDKNDIEWPYSFHEVMKENQSDKCLTELFGTSGSGKRCDITESCWNRMTKFGYSGFSLSHQIFYLQIASRAGCQPEVSQHISSHGLPDVDSLQNIYCLNMLKEAELIANANFPEFRQDLFMEQGALCGMLGYRDFSRTEWLEKILSWQDNTRGCFRHQKDFITDSLLKKMQGLKKVETKRVEKGLPGGCLCHKTAVASAALSQYIRYLVEHVYPENTIETRV